MVGPNTVLVVDDDEGVLAFVNSVASKHYRVVTAVSGPECIETLGREHPDVILLDVIMTTTGLRLRNRSSPTIVGSTNR